MVTEYRLRAGCNCAHELSMRRLFYVRSVERLAGNNNNYV